MANGAEASKTFSMGNLHVSMPPEATPGGLPAQKIND